MELFTWENNVMTYNKLQLQDYDYLNAMLLCLHTTGNTDRKKHRKFLAWESGLVRKTWQPFLYIKLIANVSLKVTQLVVGKLRLVCVCHTHR